MWRRIAAMFRSGAMDDDLESELETHLALLEEDLKKRGLSSNAARRAARIQLGGVASLRQQHREIRGVPSVEDLWRDARYALRGMRCRPAFTAVAITTLGLAIGANTAMFSIVYGVLLKPLPYPNPPALVSAWSNTSISPDLYRDYKAQSAAFQQLGVWSNGTVAITGLGDPEQIDAVRVSHGTLDALGVQPMLGRWFSEADDSPGAEETVILTHGYWRTRFGSDRSVVGRRILVDARPRVIIAVMPRTFEFPTSNGLLILPEQFDYAQPNYAYQCIGRLKDGVSLDEARADLSRIIAAWQAQGRIRGGGQAAPRIDPLMSEVVGNLAPMLRVLMGTVALVLVIACANIMNLLLVRAQARQQEFATRAALGASSIRIAREMLIDSSLLAVAGGVVGLAWAAIAIRLLLASQLALPRAGEIAINAPVVFFTLALSLLAGFLFGAAPAWHYARTGLGGAIRPDGRALTPGSDRLRVRNALVVVQVALALVLLVASGLMLRTAQTLSSIDPGFATPEQIQLLSVSLPEDQFREPERVMRIQEEMLGRLAAIPGVQAVAFGDSVPLGGRNPGNFISPEGRTYAPDEVRILRRYRFVTPGYLETLGIPLLAGRDFTWTDVYGKRSVVLVSENLAREIWGSAAGAVGKRFRPGRTGSGPWREVIGVTGDVYYRGLYEPAPPMVYWPAMVHAFAGDATRVSARGTFAIRTERAATESFLDEARLVIWSIQGDLPVFDVFTLQDLVDDSTGRTRSALVMLVIASLMALGLGVVGIYGVIAYAVSQRRKEIGIRLALGAPPGSVQRMFLINGLVLSTIGLILGGAAAAGLARLMTSMLFGVAPIDIATFAVAGGVLAIAALAASYLPARRAAASDSLEALRLE
jgi:predicted permease